MELRFDIQFHGPFRVGTGRPGSTGADDGVDPHDPLPGSSLKGALRATAVSLRCEAGLVSEVFGTPASPSPWYFSGGKDWSWRSPVTPGGDPVPTVRTRVAIDDERGVAQRRALLMTEELWPDHGMFHIDLIATLDDEQRRIHRLVLLLAAAGTQAIGGDRRRGLGWVTMAMSGATDDDLRRAAELSGGSRG